MLLEALFTSLMRAVTSTSPQCNSRANMSGHDDRYNINRLLLNARASQISPLPLSSRSLRASPLPRSQSHHPLYAVCCQRITSTELPVVTLQRLLIVPMSNGIRPTLRHNTSCDTGSHRSPHQRLHRAGRRLRRLPDSSTSRPTEHSLSCRIRRTSSAGLWRQGSQGGPSRC